jgi:hypothetical protein
MVQCRVYERKAQRLRGRRPVDARDHGAGAAAALAVPYVNLAGVRISQDEVIKQLRATASEISSRLR